MFKMTFTTGGEKNPKPAPIVLKPLPKLGDFMSLKSLKETSKGCKSCGN